MHPPLPRRSIITLLLGTFVMLGGLTLGGCGDEGEAAARSAEKRTASSQPADGDAAASQPSGQSAAATQPGKGDAASGSSRAAATTPATDDLAQMLTRYVDDGGWVDYAALAEDPAALDRYIDSLKGADLDAMTRDGRLATLINAYNAYVLKLVAENYDGGKLKSINDIPEEERFEAQRWELAGQTVSLNEIENRLIRQNYDEPRIHWALVCGAYSCPPLRDEPYTAEALGKQLADQEQRVLSDERFYRYDADAKTLHLTSILDWYGEDFVAAAGSVAGYVAQRKQGVATDPAPKIEFIDYDWKLNSRANAPSHQ